MKVPRRLLLGILIPLVLSPQISLAARQSRTPQDVVRLFMEVYGTERMAEILPYTTSDFRDGLGPELWLKRTYGILKSIGYVRLAGVIQSAIEKDNQATIVVASRIKTKGVTGTQTEIYRLWLSDQGWKLLDLEVQNEVIREEPPGSVSLLWPHAGEGG